MATVDKAFRIKNGLVVEGASATVNGSNVLTEASTSFLNELSVDAVATAISNGTQTNITITYSDETNSLSFNASGGVSSLTGTANEVEVSASTGAITIGLPDNITVGGNITINGTPTLATHAATKGYVDEVAQGLHIHASCVAATTSGLTATYSNGLSGVGATLTNSGTQAALVIDGVTLSTSDRVLVKNQSSQLQNGIYVVTDTGSVSTNWILTRASDYDTTAEVDGGDFTFVTGGTLYDNTGWVQISTAVTIGTDAIVFEQFSGAGTYNAGNGLTLNGTTFSINTAITADLTSTQSLTNKTLTSPSITNPTVSGLYISDNNITIEGTADIYETTLTFTNPTDDRTITFKDASGTVAYTADIETAVDNFGSAVTGGTGISTTYATTNNVLTITNTDPGSAQNIFKTITIGSDNITADSNTDVLTVTSGTGISVTAATSTDTITITNSGVTSITGTANQVIASSSTGSVTLSLPQSIATTSSPTFAGLSVGAGSLTAGSVTLTDALLGTATTSISGTSATVVDTWSVASYRSAKYIVQMINANDIEVLEVLVTVDGNNNVYLTEYADVQSNVQIGTTNADYVAGEVRLLVTSSNGTTVKVHKTLIEA